VDLRKNGKEGICDVSLELIQDIHAKCAKDEMLE